MKILFGAILVLLAAVQAQAAVTTQPVEYKHGDTILEGWLAYDDSLSGKAPGVLVAHEWWGLNDYAKKRAEELAGMGYVAFALDMYGKGVVTADPKEAAKLSGQVKGTPLMRERALAGLQVLAESERVDPSRIGAIGFCFGGTTVLELAYAGGKVAGVVSFHGGLTLPGPEDLSRIRSSILVLHGAEDPHVPADEAAAFREAMSKAGVDWQMIYYGGAVHSFTNPDAGSTGLKGVAYDAKAAERSWTHMRVFFDEILKRDAP